MIPTHQQYLSFCMTAAHEVVKQMDPKAIRRRIAKDDLFPSDWMSWPHDINDPMCKLVHDKARELLQTPELVGNVIALSDNTDSFTPDGLLFDTAGQVLYHIALYALEADIWAELGVMSVHRVLSLLPSVPSSKYQWSTETPPAPAEGVVVEYHTTRVTEESRCNPTHYSAYGESFPPSSEDGVTAWMPATKAHLSLPMPAPYVGDVPKFGTPYILEGKAQIHSIRFFYEERVWYLDDRPSSLAAPTGPIHTELWGCFVVPSEALRRQILRLLGHAVDADTEWHSTVAFDGIAAGQLNGWTLFVKVAEPNTPTPA
jgi:hypothetical protein